MAQPALDFFKKRALLLKAEVTEGTDSSPVAGTDGFRFFDGSSSTEFDKVERPLDKSFFGSDPFVVTNKRAKIEGQFELYPPATPGGVSTSDADCAKILLPSGMAVTKDAPGKTTIYNPISSAIPTATAYWYHVRRLLKVLGARGDISSLSMEIGERFTGQGSLMGDYADWSTQAMVAPTLPTKVPVTASARNMRSTLSTLIKGATASTSGAPLSDLLVWAKGLSIDFGNSLNHKEYSSKSVNQIDDRLATWTMRIATTDITNDFDPLFVRDSGIVLVGRTELYETSGTPSATLSGLYSALQFRGQIETVTPTDIDGDDGWEISGPCIPSASGGDEFLIEFGDA